MLSVLYTSKLISSPDDVVSDWVVLVSAISVAGALNAELKDSSHPLVKRMVVKMILGREGMSIKGG